MELKVKFIASDDWVRPTKWELLEAYTSLNGAVNVPVGFRTDGASIPRIFRFIFSATGRYFSAAVVHDYLIETTQDWNTANIQFEAELNALDIVGWRKDLMLHGVKFWAWMLKKLGKNSISEL